MKKSSSALLKKLLKKGWGAFNLDFARFEIFKMEGGAMPRPCRTKKPPIGMMLQTEHHANRRLLYIHKKVRQPSLRLTH